MLLFIGTESHHHCLAFSLNSLTGTDWLTNGNAFETWIIWPMAIDDEDANLLLADNVYCDIFADAKMTSLCFSALETTLVMSRWFSKSKAKFCLFLECFYLFTIQCLLLVLGFVQGPPHLQENRQKQTRPELTDTFLILHSRRHDDDVPIALPVL